RPPRRDRPHPAPQRAVVPPRQGLFGGPRGPPPATPPPPRNIPEGICPTKFRARGGRRRRITPASMPKKPNRKIAKSARRRPSSPAKRGHAVTRKGAWKPAFL